MPTTTLQAPKPRGMVRAGPREVVPTDHRFTDRDVRPLINAILERIPTIDDRAKAFRGRVGQAMVHREPLTIGVLEILGRMSSMNDLMAAVMRYQKFAGG